MKKMNFELPEYAVEILNEMYAAGYEAYVVGGSVRDLICRKMPADYDITTNARPEQMKDVFKDKGKYKIIETGIKHGTVTVMCGKNSVEATTYRIDGEYLDSRRPENVAFTENLRLDLERRDFTMNAIVYSPDTGIRDFFGGIKDIEEKRVKCIGDPYKRFEEDALRILRAVRFSAVLGFSIDPATSEAIHAQKKLLEKISAERISAELKKLFASDFPEIVENILLEYRDVFVQIFGKLPEGEKYAELCSKVKRAPNENLLRFIYFISAVSEFDSEAAERSIMRLKPSTELKKRVLYFTSAYHEAECALDAVQAKMLVKKFGFSYAEDAAAILKHIGENAVLSDMIEKIKRDGECVTVASLAVGGKDLLKHTNVPPNRIGEVLGNVLDEIICGKLENSDNAIIAYINRKCI